MAPTNVAVVPLVPEDKDEISKLVTEFIARQAYYADRVTAMNDRDRMFDGEHWPPEEEADTVTTNDVPEKKSFKLVFNYTRRIVLSYIAALAREPKPKVPSPTDPLMAANASIREKYLLSLWDDVMEVWYDVETNAAKYGWGVMQAVWAPPVNQPRVLPSQNFAGATVVRYTESPWVFRSIPVDRFYPVYRTLSKPNDFLKVFHYDPNRLIDDLEEQYNVKLDATGMMAPDGWQCLGTEPTCDLVAYWTKDKYILLALTRGTYESVVERGKKTNREVYYELVNTDNPMKVIPFWVVQNMRGNPQKDPTKGGSISDVDDIGDINRHYDEIMSEAAEEVVIQIHQPVVYKSSDHTQKPSDVVIGAGKAIPIDIEEELDTLKFSQEAPLVENHIERVMQSMKDLSFLGDAGFGIMNAQVSGVAARIAMVPMQQVLELKIPQRRRTLQAVCAYILRVTESKLKVGEDGAREGIQGWIMYKGKRYGEFTLYDYNIDGAYYADIDYGNLLPRDDFAFEQNEVYKLSAGAQSIYDTLDHIGVDDPAAAIERIKQEAQDPILNPEKVTATATAKQSQQQMAAPMAPTAPTGPAQPQTGGAMAGNPMAANAGASNPLMALMGGGMPQPGNGMTPPLPQAGAEEQGVTPGPVQPFMER